MKQFYPSARTLFTMALIVMFGSACGARMPTPIAAVPTIAPLGLDATYWDLGATVKYPANWAVPLYGAGQMLLAPTVDATSRNPPTDPLIALQVGTLERLGLGKEAALADIAVAASGKTRDQKVLAQGASTFAGLDAAFIDIQDSQKNLYEQTIAFRMPDGRIGWLIAVTPLDQWANFAPTAEQIRASGSLLKPTAYSVPKLAGNDTFPQGGLTFTLPEGWSNKPLGSARLYHSKDDVTYQDGSGFSNGPQLVIQARPLAANQSLQDAVVQTIGAGQNKPVDISVGGQPGTQLTSSDPDTGQQVIFIGVASKDKTILNLVRWTTPGALDDVARPILDSILKSVAFDAISATLVPAQQAANNSTLPTPSADFFKGIPQSSTADGAFVVGTPTAPVHVIEFLDFSCPHCYEYSPLMHEFINTAVRSGKARVEMRYLTFVGQQFSVTAATAALCAGEQGKQGEMHDRLFYLQGARGVQYFMADNLTQEAVELGMDQAAFAACMTKGKADVLAANDALSRIDKVTGTPAILVAKGSDAPSYLSQNDQAVTIPSLELLQSTVDQLMK